MPRRPSTAGSGPIDIFNDDDIGRAAEALTAATAPITPTESSPPQVVAKETQSEERGSKPEALESVSSRAALSPPTSAAKREPDARPATRDNRAVEPAMEAPERFLERNVGLKLSVPQSLKSDFQTFRVELSAALGGVSIDDSNIGRPIVEQLLIEHRERILQAAKEHRGELRRPVNRDPVAMAEFDEALGAIFREALAAPRRRKTQRADG